MKEKSKKAHGVQLLIRAVVTDPDGKVISDTGKKPSKSYVIQFLEFIYSAIWDHTITTATATDGTEDQFYNSGVSCATSGRVDALVAEDSWGLVVGTGIAAESNTDHKLETQLTEGTGAGNISHGDVTLVTTAVVGANVDLEVKRPFTNLTGSTITVKEAGLYSNYGETYFHCLTRDVLAASVEVPDKCTLTMYLTLRTTV